MAPTTLVTRLAHWASTAPDAPAIHGGSPDKGFTTYTWADYYTNVRQVAKSLIKLGTARGEKVAIIGRNRPEWVIADLGVMAAGAVPTPIYATNTADQVAWLLRHSGAKIAIIDDADQYEKFAEISSEFPDLTIVSMGATTGWQTPHTHSWEEFLAIGEKTPESLVNERINRAKEDDLALLCYTSGTTGEPKGVMLTHANFEALAGTIERRFPFEELSERVISYLPLCHIAEHLFSLVNAQAFGIEVYFCDDINFVKDYLPEVRPTLFLAVPRVWEKFEAALSTRLGEATGVKAVLANWAIGTEASWFESELEAGTHITGITRVVAEQLVLGKVKDALGMDKVRYCFSGAAPLNPATADFFASLGLPIHEVYGMTETTGVISMPPPRRTHSGKVGQPLDGVQVRIAADGEIIVRGKSMTPGYFGAPEATAELIDAEGWLHTGDIGQFDDDGFLQITDRKKELFKTSGGKYVAPAPIESKLKSVPVISQAVLVGDGQKFIGALVTIDPEKTSLVATAVGLDPSLPSEALAKDEAVQDWLYDQVHNLVNVNLARYEQIKRIHILPQEMSPESGELTPTLKLRRKIIADIHGDEIRALYSN